MGHLFLNFLQFISMPTADEADRISDEIFQQTGFPYVVGVIDGTHIELMKPKGISSEANT